MIAIGFVLLGGFCVVGGMVWGVKRARKAGDGPERAEAAAVASLLVELESSCPASWERPRIVDMGLVQPFGYPRGQGWHIRTRRSSQPSGLDGTLDIWVMTGAYGRQEPQVGTKAKAADENPAWPYGQAFVLGMGGADWASMERDVSSAMERSSPKNAPGYSNPTKY